MASQNVHYYARRDTPRAAVRRLLAISAQQVTEARVTAVQAVAVHVRQALTSLLVMHHAPHARRDTRRAAKRRFFATSAQLVMEALVLAVPAVAAHV